MNVYRVNETHWDLYGNSTNENDYVFTYEQLEGFAKDWEKPIDELLDHCEEEQYEYHCNNCNNYTNKPLYSTTVDGTDADGNRGWTIQSLVCPQCGCDY